MEYIRIYNIYVYIDINEQVNAKARKIRAAVDTFGLPRIGHSHTNTWPSAVRSLCLRYQFRVRYYVHCIEMSIRWKYQV